MPWDTAMFRWPGGVMSQGMHADGTRAEHRNVPRHARRHCDVPLAGRRISGCELGSIRRCCAPGRNMVLKVSGSNRGIVWAHEFGHATGLQHRSEPKALMTSVPLAPDQRYVNQGECDSFVSGPPVAAPANAVEQTKAESPGVS